MIMGMDVQALRWFQLVADGETVTDVAHEFLVSQPGVSRALTRLEQEVGVPLLRKRGRGLTLTQAGSVFKRHVDGVLHRLDDGLAALEQLADPETGHVVLGFQPSLGAWLVPALIRRFSERHPAVTFTLRHADDTGASLVATGGVDLELTSQRPADESVAWHRVVGQPLALAVAADHPLARLDAVTLDQVREEPFVALRRHWHLRDRADALCKRAGFEARIVFELDDLPGVSGFVAAGLGVAIVPRGTGGGDGAATSLVPIADPEAHRDIGLAWSRERRLLPSTSAFRDHVIAEARRLTA